MAFLGVFVFSGVGGESKCLLSRESVPYDSMYPLCLLPVVPSGVPYHNIIDKKLIDAMFDKQFFPSSSEALSFRLEDGISIWSYLRFRMGHTQ